MTAFSNQAMSVYSPKVATNEYTIESTRMLFHLCRLLNMRYTVKKSQDKIRMEELYRIAISRPTIGSYLLMIL